MILEQEKIKSDNVNGIVQSSIAESNFPQITETKKPIEINDKPVEIKLNETNITDNRKAKKKIKTPTYSEVVKRTANKDIGEKITNLEEIKASLLRDSLTQAYKTSPPVLGCDSTICKNSPDQLGLNEQTLGDVLSSHDDELLRILEDLQNEKSVKNNSNCSDNTRISGYFCSDTVFSLNRSVLSEDETKVLEKELNFAPIQNIR